MTPNTIWTRSNPFWDAIRAALFEPCRTARRGRPWEDLA